jgi:hypothetical protein
MRIIFHIGMGKTGTSSIQVALRENKELLKEQNAHYFGMWFDMLDSKFFGLSGTSNFLKESPEAMLEYAKKLIEIMYKMNECDGTESFIVSNEAIFQNPECFIYMLNCIDEDPLIETSVIGYVRNPVDWINSAYAQWGIYHKTSIGPIPSIGDFAPQLLSQYDGIIYWLDGYRGNLQIRSFDKDMDVVADFGETSKLQLDSLSYRFLEGKSVAELILRREFNNLFHHPVLPGLFDDAVPSKPLSFSESLEEVLNSMFVSEQVMSCINDKSELWNAFEEKLGVDVFKLGGVSSMVDTVDVRNKILENLVSIVMSQSKRIYRLELMLKSMDE